LPRKDREERNAYFREWHARQKETHNAYKREWRKQHPECSRKHRKKWRALHPEQHRAQEAVRRALRAGKLTKAPCWCGEVNVEAHHPDYDKPLEVAWLCQEHHGQITRKTKNAGTIS